MDESQGANSAVVVNGDDPVTYTPNPAFVGIDVFTYVVEEPAAVNPRPRSRSPPSRAAPTAASPPASGR